MTHPQFGQLSIIILDGKEMFKAKEVASMLGYKDTINAVKQHCKGVVKYSLPSKSGKQTFNLIPEGDLWRLIIRSKLPQAEQIEKWIMDEVLPTIRKTGGYAMPKQEGKQLTFEEYNYFDKTYNDDPVLSLADVEHFTGAKRNTIMKAINCSCVEFFDYYLLRKKDLMKFKAENPKVNKLASELYVITKEGVKTICRFCKIKPELPSAFTTEVISCKEKKKEEYAVIIGNTRMQGMIKGIKRKLTAVEVLLDSCNRHNMSVNDVETIRQALRKVSDDLATDITVFSYEKYQTTTSFKF